MAEKFTQNPKKNGKIAGDDRNLVLVDDDFADADFEDKVWLFWKRHGKKTVAAAVIVFLVCFAGIVWSQSKQIHLNSLQNAYAALPDDAARTEFAANHMGDAMAGTILLTQANALAEKQEFAAAAEKFELAGTAFAAENSNDLAMARDRAKFAAAECRYKAGETEKALEMLRALAGTLETDETIRGQAMWSLALVKYRSGDIAGTREQLAEMERALGPANLYREMMEELRKSDAALRE